MVASRVREDDWGNSLSVGTERLVIRLADGQVLEIPTAAVTFVGYRREAIPDNGVIGLPALPAPIPIFYLGWVRKTGLYFLAIEYTRPDRTSARVVLQVIKDDYVSMLRAVSAATHVRISVAGADRKRLPTGLPTTDLDHPLLRAPGVPTWRVERLVGHRKGVTSVTFSPNGKWIASAADDGTLLVWDLPGRLAAGR